MKRTSTAFVFLLFAINQAESLVCLNCDDVFHPHTCKHVTECFKDEMCGIETYISNDGLKKYKLGCVDVNTCGHYGFTSPPSVSHGFQACHECCSSGNLCNAAGCNSTGYPGNRGPICYHCENNPPGIPCHKIEFCEEHEFCYNEATLEFQTNTLYSSGCRSKHNCASAEVNPIIGKRNIDTRSVSICTDCCSGDLCNTNCKKREECSDHDTCQLLMQNYDVCGVPDVARQFCRKSCNLCSSHPTCNDTTATCYLQATLVAHMCDSFQTASDNGCLKYCGYCSSTTTPFWTPSYFWTNQTSTPYYWTSTSPLTIVPWYRNTTLPPAVEALMRNMTVGTRVIRGPDWDWGDQDLHSPGTITSLSTGSPGWVEVKWDYSGSYSYRLGADGKYDLQLYQGYVVPYTDTTPSPWPQTSLSYIPTGGTTLTVGDRVVRGPDWKWGDQDHHSVGTILSIYSTPGWVEVRWDYDGSTESYRMGAENATDLQLYRGGSTTNTTSLSTTMGGHTVFIGQEVSRGPDWKWGDQDKGGHGTVTGFDTTPGWVRVRWADGTSNVYRDGAEGARDLLPYVNNTQSTRTIPTTTTYYTISPSNVPTYGPELAALIQKGSRVVRGRDWKWYNQDHGSAGTVQSVNSDGWVTVKWDQDSTTNTYRMGAENSYDLMLAP